MLRLASKRIFSQNKIATRALSSAVAESSATAGPPSVFDSIVKLNFVDPSGARRTIPAYVGKSLYETCDVNGIDLGPASVGGAVEAVRSDTWTEPLYGEGPSTGYDHVLLVGNGADTAAPITPHEKSALGDYWDEDEIFPESRLACMVTVTKEMDGMTVYVPDRIVDDIP
ncbi:hypothetical protein CTEN210_05973 [Chaetoceros tenuissimus]|uniref:Uncharacterized protein n=1 Tax=Chaetoceros tenuissimus TaxID=426638 RepID=A0AAD3CNZ7_9STRA|nr:hypothetical protein CTEN210_05973 [Chaetoceros tenuissimus]